MVVWSGQGNVVSCFFGEDLSEIVIFQQERDFGFHLFSGDGEFGCHCEFSNKRGIWEEVFAIALEDSIDLAIIQ